MLDGLGLCGRGHAILLRLVARRLLPVARNIALQPGAQRILAVQRIGCGRCLCLHGGQGGLGLVNFGGQCLGQLRQSASLQFHGLQLHQVLNIRVHRCQEV